MMRVFPRLRDARSARASWFGLFLLILAACRPVEAQNASFDDLWAGRAHFEERPELRFGDYSAGPNIERASWYVVEGGRWYAFSRFPVQPPVATCPNEHMQVVVRESSDHGKTWSPAVTAVRPGASAHGDGCAVVDGGSFFDRGQQRWHLLAQCLDRNDAGGWSLCHYTRRGRSPLGAFVADPANPVVRGGALWSRICGPAKACPTGVVDEGTPDIVAQSGGRFIVTMHGFDQGSGRGYRTAVATRDFRHWETAGPGLPNDASLSTRDCAGWFKDCVGFGEGSSVVEHGRIVTLAETMNKSLLCQKDQRWVFVLLRSRTSAWPRSGAGWEQFRQTPLLHQTYADQSTPCAISYARLIRDGARLFLTYEDWEPNYGRLHRRLFELTAGGGPPLRLTDAGATRSTERPQPTR